MKKIILLSLTAMVFGGCTHDFSHYETPIDVSSLPDKDPNAVTKEDIQANVASIFGTIDPEQDWNLVNEGSVTITADADLDNIVKVQVLSESPFFNPNVSVLSEAEAKNGETVTLNYEAPREYTRLVAACVDNEGIYHIKSFPVGQESVSFTISSAARSKTRAAVDYPELSKIVLEPKNASLSFNAIRNQYADQAAAGDPEMKKWVDANNIGIWADKGWENERLWKATDNNNIGSSWKIEKGCIYRAVDDMDTDEKDDLELIFKNLLGRNKSNGRDKFGELKQDNLEPIRNSTAVSLYNNHIISNGATPITVSPVQLASTESHLCTIYYYYYNPKDIPAIVSEEEYVKSLPKFRAIDCNLTGHGTPTFSKSREYLLPFYGDEFSAPKELSDYKSDGKVYRFRNGQQYQGNDYYLSYHGNMSRCGVKTLMSDEDLSLGNQLWQIFTNEATGESFLYNLGTHSFLLHEEGTTKEYMTSFTGIDYLSEKDVPVRIDDQNHCITRSNSTTLGLGTDLNNESKAKQANVSSDKSTSADIGKWYKEEYTGSRKFTLKDKIQSVKIQAISNIIPEGYKVGFMIKKSKNGDDVRNLDAVKGVDNGCCYGFGSMNKTLNQFGSFASSVTRYSMKIDDPRILMFEVNNKTFLAFEEGSDCQFSDVIIEITQGVNSISDPIENIEQSCYTVCIEDRPISDYDMNDVILTAERKDQTHITLTVYACGAYDDLYLRGLNGSKLNETTEIHQILGAANGTFVNTSGKMDKEPVSEDFEVGANTSIIEFLKGISIYDATIDHTIVFSGKGDDPHAIIVPCRFDFPTEHVSINTAYPAFQNWARNAKTDLDWYKNPAPKDN